MSQSSDEEIPEEGEITAPKNRDTASNNLKKTVKVLSQAEVIAKLSDW